MSLRMEKRFGTWFREFRPIYTPLEAGMDRYLKFDHDFIGREAVEAELSAGGPKRRMVMFEVDVDESEPADVIGDEPVWLVGGDADRVVGWVTSGGYAHYSALSLAWGYVPAELADGFQKDPAVDPAGLRMRA
jgi:dimethylglycine dehydrogenase